MNTSIIDRNLAADARKAPETVRRVHIINPAAGGGRYAKRVAERLKVSGETYVMTEHPGHACVLTERFCREEPGTHIYIYGGDGSAGDAAEGILRAGAENTAVLTCMPAGSGNDFAGFINSSVFAPGGTDGGFFKLDVLRSRERCSVNIINGGFDCGVVARTENLRRRGIGGKLSYIMGVAAELALKKSFNGVVRLSGVVSTDGLYTPLEDEEHSGEFLLCAFANARCYGGGFMAAPAADPTDGYMDLILVKNVARLRFISLVGDYKSGSHITDEGAVKEQFADLVCFRRCRRAQVEGFPLFCFDGEVTPVKKLCVETIPGAVWYKKPDDVFNNIIM